MGLSRSDASNVRAAMSQPFQSLGYARNILSAGALLGEHWKGINGTDRWWRGPDRSW